jgi:hypothetical protein
MGGPTQAILFPFISVPFRQPARQNPANHFQTFHLKSEMYFIILNIDFSFKEMIRG